MRCSISEAELVDAAAGLLPADRQQAVLVHCATCPTCAARFGELQGLFAALPRSSQPIPGDAAIRLRVHVNARIDEITAGSAVRSKGFPFARLSWLAIPVAATAVVLALLRLTPSSDETPLGRDIRSIVSGLSESQLDSIDTLLHAIPTTTAPDAAVIPIPDYVESAFVLMDSSAIAQHLFADLTWSEVADAGSEYLSTEHMISIIDVLADDIDGRERSDRSPADTSPEGIR